MVGINPTIQLWDEASLRDDAMEMGMKGEVLTPSVQQGNHSGMRS